MATSAWPGSDVPAHAFPAYPGSVPAARDYVSAALDRVPTELRETAALSSQRLLPRRSVRGLRAQGGEVDT